MIVRFGGNDSFRCTRIFRDKYQVSIPDYITITRIKHAKELLAHTNKSVQDIATAVGFLERNTFTRLFKKLEGVTPGAYRSLALGEENGMREE